MMPSTNQPVMNILCGSDSCTPQKWLDYMGSTSNGHTPFPINFHIRTNSSSRFPQPLNVSAFDCSVRPDAHTPACSCSDCPASCPPVPPPPVPPKPCLIFGRVDCLVAGMTALFTVLASTFLLFTCLRARRVPINEWPIIGARAELLQTAPGSTHSNARGGQRLQELFHSWARLCWLHPAWVIFASLLAAAALCSGIITLRVTTDPVLLWSAPHSQTRLQYNDFNRHFGKFWRIEQVSY